MGIGVGTYSDGFGVAFTLLDQFSAVAKKIKASMSSLTSSTQSFAAKTSGSGYGYGAAREARIVANERIQLAGLEEEAALKSLSTQYFVSRAQFAMAEQQEISDVQHAALAARLSQGEAQRSRLHNSLAREQMILNRQAEEQAIATAAAEAALNAERAMGLTLLGASLVGLALIVKGAVVESHFEKAELTIEGFVGSAQKAHEAFLQIQADAKNNPMMGFENMLKTNSLLLSQGISEGPSERITKNLSDLLTSVGRGAPELNRVGRELEKIAANGKITGRELYQAAAAGIPLRNILEDYFGKKLPNTLKELPITIDDLDGAFQKAMISGGRYGKAFAKIAESIAFKWADLTNNQIPQFFAAIGKAVEPITTMVVAGLGMIFSILKMFSQTWVGQVFWVISGALLLLAGVIGLNIVGGKAWTWVLARLTHGLGHATIASLKASMANEGLAASFALLGETVMANPAFWWFATIGAAIVVASSAMKHFKRVVSGEDGVGKGLTGQLQKLGGVLHFVSEAFSTYNSETGLSNVSRETYQALNALGEHDLAERLERLVIAIMSIGRGMLDIAQIVSKTVIGAFTGLAEVVTGVINVVISVVSWFGYAVTSMDAMRVMGWLLAAALIAVNWSATISTNTIVFGFGVKVVMAMGRAIASALSLAYTLIFVQRTTASVAAGLSVFGLIASAATVVIMGIVSAFTASSSAADMAADSYDGVTKAITMADIAQEKLQRHLNKMTALDNVNLRIAYEQQYNPNSDEVKALLKQKGKIQADLQADDPYIRSQGVINTYRGSSAAVNSGGTGEDNRNVNATLVVDGKILATVLLPYTKRLLEIENNTAQV